MVNKKQGRDWGMSPAQQVAKKVIEVLEVFADKRAHFTVSQLRRLTGIKADGNFNAHLWNLWRSLEEADVVEELDTGRKRNRIYRVASPERLNAFRPVSGMADLDEMRESDEMSPAVAERLDRLERAIQQLTEKVRQLAD